MERNVQYEEHTTKKTFERMIELKVAVDIVDSCGLFSLFTLVFFPQFCR